MPKHQSLVVIIEGLLPLTQFVINKANAVEGDGLPGAVIGGVSKRHSLTIVIESLLPLTQAVKDLPHVVERLNLLVTVGHRAHERQRHLKFLESYPRGPLGNVSLHGLCERSLSVNATPVIRRGLPQFFNPDL